MPERQGWRRALLIVNQNARLGHEAGRAAQEVFKRNRIDVLHETCGSREALAETIRRRAGEVDLVAIGGGDGTLNAAAPALVDTRLPFAILPLGTANDLARTLGLPTDPGAAAQIVATGHLRDIDVGEVNGIHYFNVASLGLSERIAKELSGDVKKKLGILGYVVATIRTLVYIRPFSAEILFDGVARKVRTIQIAVGNGRHYGGGLTVAETAEIDDGRLDVYSLETDRLWKLALSYPAFRRGRLKAWSEARTAVCTEVEIRTRRPRSINTDGEITTTTPARFRVLPKAVRVYVPADGAGTGDHTRSV